MPKAPALTPALAAASPNDAPTHAKGEAIAFKGVRLRHANAYLSTEGVEVGERCENAPFAGAIVTGLFGMALGVVIELRQGDSEVSILHTGDYAGVMA